ncbi:hypothetical protein [Natrinema sp. CGMCC1.2065]|uniref:hypothetical protein n=1 Tax=Natrinema sp. CGMCC1.2065 TaxID=3445767 RepID=UPI003F4A505C
MSTELGREPDVFETVRSVLCNHPDDEATIGNALSVYTESETRAFEEGAADSSAFGELEYSIKKNTVRVGLRVVFEGGRIEK